MKAAAITAAPRFAATTAFWRRPQNRFSMFSGTRSAIQDIHIGDVVAWPTNIGWMMGPWLIYATLLWGRHQLGWRGKTAIKWTIAGFSLLILAYFGSKFVLEFVLKRPG